MGFVRFIVVLGLSAMVSVATIACVQSSVVRGRAGANGLIAASRNVKGADALRAGDEAARSNDLSRADEHYRLAWSDPRTRDSAASRLQRLHQDRDFERLLPTVQINALKRALGATFRVHESDHFVVLSDAPRTNVTARTDLLERTFDQFFRVMDRMEFPAVPPREKLVCVFFAEHRDYAAFAKSYDGVDSGWVAGYYAGLSNHIVFYDDSTSPAFNAAFNELKRYEQDARSAQKDVREARRRKDFEEAEILATRAADMQRRVHEERRRLEREARRTSDAKTIHEAVHLLAFNCGVQSRSHEYPFWLTEGLASNFETDRPRARFGPDRPTPARDDEYNDLVRSGRLLPLADLIARTKPPENDNATVDAMYAQSHALFEHLFRHNRRALGEYLMTVQTQAGGGASKSSRARLFSEHFGSLGGLDRRLMARAE